MNLLLIRDFFEICDFDRGQGMSAFYLMMKNANRCENLFSVVMFIYTISSFPDNTIDNTIENETGNFTNFKRNIHESHFR